MASNQHAPSLEQQHDGNGASHNYSDDVSVPLSEEQNSASTESSEENTIMQQFFTAASEGNMLKVQQCINQVSGINQLDSNGRTALHLAVKSGNTEVCLLY